jgi:hypothetical protein
MLDHKRERETGAHDPERRVETKEKAEHLVGSYMRAEVTIMIATIVFGIIGIIIFNAGRSASLSKGFSHIIRPRDLSSVHRIDKIKNDCKNCHEYTGEIKDKKCLVCHKLIQERMESRSGYHGTHEKPCRDCHKEHPKKGGLIIDFDEKQFDHDQALFRLEGKHDDLKCDECHKKREPTGRMSYIERLDRQGTQIRSR